MWRIFSRRLLFLFFLISVSVWFSGYLYQQSAAGALHAKVIGTDEFRKMQLSNQTLSLMLEASASEDILPGDVMTILYPFSGEGSIKTGRSTRSLESGLSKIALWRTRLIRRNRNGYFALREAYAAIWNDVECFPVTGTSVYYENSWMFERNYGGKRGHEGTDLMPAADLAGVFPVVSMTDGVVEKIGWLEQGGYRIGIRSPSGGYFYYAHLDSYAQKFSEGDAVFAGEQLGMMGNTGYGEEGTAGRFAVHLHVGIYIRADTGEDGGSLDELSVNPYWVLRYAAML
ncbi:MAG: M23 family metallopeptidase [Lachnospiraceae bacterium]|nr:M23 family metallopeptidase [Lachnospiraceae bacterium]